MKEHKFPYKWTLKDAVFTKDKGKVFSCFACGGGSTMGYKLAGFDVLGCNEIDYKMIEAYKVNHNPKYAFLEPIQTFKLRTTKAKAIERFGSLENYELAGGDEKWLMPSELYDLDILDGSPPCSSFSMAGNREKDWGKYKVFREGQAMQILDTLFFNFIDLAKELQPKIVVAENVEGLLLGNAKSYVIQIYKEFDKAGYYCQHFLLDSKNMGVPQRRRRVFFICLRKDLASKFLHQKDMFTLIPKIEMIFNEKEIKVRNFVEFEDKKETQNYSEKRFGDVILDLDRPSNTITSGVRFWLNDKQVLKQFCYNLIGSYPEDYNFNTNRIYMIGMSVPPIMTAQIASRIYDQWLSKLT